MRNLREVSRLELGQWTPGERLRFVLALGLAASAVVLAYFGQVWRYDHSDTPPLLPGMDQFWGQVGWSVLLGGLMIVAAWIVRGVIMMRLQAAIVVSLLIHLLLVLFAQRVTLAIPMAQLREQENTLDERLEELTLPDYGGMEEPQTQPQNWQLPEDVSTPEVELEAQQRSDVEHDIQLQREQREVEHQREIAEHEQMQRQRQEAEVVPENAQAAIERQRLEQEMQAPERLDAPQLERAEAVRERELTESVELERGSTAPASERREQAAVESQRFRRQTAAQLRENRTQQNPQAAREQVEQQQRQFAVARAADARAEAAEVAAAQAAQDLAARERQMEAARQAAAGLPGRAEAAESAPAGQRSTEVSARSPSLAANAQNRQPQTAPSGGGDATIARSNPNGAGTSGAASAQAEAVQVAQAGNAGGPSLQESGGARVSERGTVSSVPSRNTTAGTGAVAGRSPGVRSAALPGGSGTAGNSNAQAGQPRVTGGPGRQTTGRSQSGGALAAVGTDAGSVAVPGTAAGGTGSSGNQPLVSGPVDTRVDRRATGLPGGSGRQTGTAPRGVGGSATSAIGSTSGSSLASRGTEPSARLGALSGSGRGEGNLFSGRSAISSALPSAVVQAEQTGALVTAGPQASASSSGGLSAPATATIRRRSAGLPGGLGAPGPVSPSGGSSSARPSGTAGGGLVARRSDFSGPSLQAQQVIAGALRRSGAANLDAAESNVRNTFSMRQRTLRGQIAESFGGSAASEEAVEAGLDWLARHQHADGHWSIHAFHEQCQDHRCTGPGSFHADTAATGLALLAFYGAAYTHNDGKHQQTVLRGLEWLLKGQKSDGDLFTDEAEFVWLYSHGMAAIALCEAYGMTKDPALRVPAQKAVDFIVASQHPQFGGWRYRPRFESDTSVSGWQVMALKSGEISGLQIPTAAYAGAAGWLDSVESKTAPGQYKYHPSRSESLAMTAEALLMRQYLGASRDEKRLRAGADHLLENLPELAQRDAYYWYYATQVMFHLQGEHWEQWNARLRDLLVNSQVKEGGPAGSWNPDQPTQEKWGAAGGRVYVTCLNLLMLEVYYRHLPLYLQLDK